MAKDYNVFFVLFLSDVEELSAKLMARLAEAQTTNTLRITKENEEMFLIDNPINSKNFRPVEVKCIYIDRISGKDFFFWHNIWKRTLIYSSFFFLDKSLAPLRTDSRAGGNVYID